MRKFEELHPITLLLFFLTILVPAMFLMDLYIALLLLGCGMLYYHTLTSKNIIKYILFAVSFVLIVTVANMLVSHSGETILFFINNRAITLEACIYGATTGIMLSGVFMWFLCLNNVLTNEKIICIFGRFPKFALIISMILRLIPRYLEKYENVLEINKNENRQCRLKAFGGTLTYAMENSMQTAKIMEMRGYISKKRQFSPYKIRKRDIVLNVYILILAVAGLFLREIRFVAMGVLCITPYLYRWKETIKLWIYNRK